MTLFFIDSADVEAGEAFGGGGKLRRQRPCGVMEVKCKRGKPRATTVSLRMISQAVLHIVATSHMLCGHEYGKVYIQVSSLIQSPCQIIA